MEFYMTKAWFSSMKLLPGAWFKERLFMITERRQLSYPWLLLPPNNFEAPSPRCYPRAFLPWVKASAMMLSTRHLAFRARTINSNANLPSGNEVGAPGVDIIVPAQELSHGEFVLVAWDDVPAGVSKANCIVINACFVLAWLERPGVYFAVTHRILSSSRLLHPRQLW